MPVFSRTTAFFMAVLLMVALFWPSTLFATAGSGQNNFSLTTATTSTPELPGIKGSETNENPEQTSSEAPQSQGERPVSMVKKFLDGSLLGSLFFGMPYKGFNTIDLAVLLVIIWIFLRSFRSQLPKLPQQNQKNLRQPPPDRQNSPGSKPFNPLSGPSPWTKVPGQEGSHPNMPEQKPRIRPEDLRPPTEFGKPLPPARPENSVETEQVPWPQAQEKSERGRPKTMKDNAAQAWQRFSSKSRPLNEMTLPEDFNAQEFMNGARLLYVRLQNAWGARDLSDIADFTTPPMLAIIQEQAKHDPNPMPVHIILVDGSIKSIVRQGQEEIVSVLFNTLLRTGDSTESTEIREVWHFTRLMGLSDTWKLDGIEEAA